MVFTAGQICFLIVVTECLVFSILSKGLDVIKHCSTSKTYREGLKKKGMITKDDAFFESFNKKEEEIK